MKPTDKGTRFETATVRFLRRRLGDDRVMRGAKHGVRDEGDLCGLVAHGHMGIIECKTHKRWGESDLSVWKAQTIAERGNADADFALLVVHKEGVGEKRFGQNHCYLQVRDLEKVMGGNFTCLAGDTAKEMWVRINIEDACKMIQADYGQEDL